MPKTSSKDKRNFDFVPANYEELYLHYVDGERSIVRTLIHSVMKGFETEEELAVLSQDIFLRCMDKKVIEGFDPAKANFGGVMFFVTRSICCNYLGRKSRDPITGLHGGSLVTEESPEEGFAPGTWNLDRFFVSTPDVSKSYEATEQVDILRTFATKLAASPRNKREESLLPLLNLLAEEFTPAECGVELGVTTTTIVNWMKYLRTVLSGEAV